MRSFGTKLGWGIHSSFEFLSISSRNKFGTVINSVGELEWDSCVIKLHHLGYRPKKGGVLWVR